MRKLIIALLALAGSLLIEVYSQTVRLDNTFGQNGKTIIPNTSEISFFDFDHLGNIVAVGYTLICGGKYHLTITKTNTDGLLDESFGNNGLVKITDYDNSYPCDLKITRDNKIIVFGSFSKVQFQGSETIMMQFNEDGSIDERFGDNGKVNFLFNPGSIRSQNLKSDDFMLIARDYPSVSGENPTPCIEKYNYDGTIDNSFGENGIVYLTNAIRPYCIKILNNDFIVIAGTYNKFPNTELGFCRLTPSGTLDTDFAEGGIWHKDVMQDFDLDHECFVDVFEDDKGNLIFSGSGLTNGQNWGNRPFLSKFSSNGVLDTSFGEDGFYCFDASNVVNPFQIGNKYIIAGWYNDAGHKIISVDDDGRFGSDLYSSDIYYFQDMKLQGSNKIISGGGYKINNTNDANFVLERVMIDLEASIRRNDYSSKELVIFPNPAKENLYFSNETAFEIINIQGNVLLKSTIPVKSVYVGNLKTGVYFVRAGNSVHKFVKE